MKVLRLHNQVNCSISVLSVGNNKLKYIILFTDYGMNSLKTVNVYIYSAFTLAVGHSTVQYGMVQYAYFL